MNKMGIINKKNYKKVGNKNHENKILAFTYENIFVDAIMQTTKN